MSINSDEVKKLANLARLSIKDDSIPKLTDNFGKVLNYVAKLQELDIKEEAKTDEKSVRLRPDEVVECGEAKNLVKSAPNHDDNFIITPKIFDKRV